MKAECLHLKHMLIVSFQVYCGGVQNQNCENCVNIQTFMDLTVEIFRFLAACSGKFNVLLSVIYTGGWFHGCDLKKAYFVFLCNVACCERYN